MIGLRLIPRRVGTDLTSRFWTGSLWRYKDPNLAPSITKCLTGVESDSGVGRVAFVGKEDKVVRVVLTSDFF